MSSRKLIMPKKHLKRLRKPPPICASRVLKMVVAMAEKTPNATGGDMPEDFLSTGRTGRRNALADVLSEHKCATTSDLPYKLERLTTSDDSNGKNLNISSSSSSNSGDQSCSSRQSMSPCNDNNMDNPATTTAITSQTTAS